MLFRKAKIEDLDMINKIYQGGSKSLKENGVDQWQGNLMPKVENKDDLKNIYVLEDEGKVVSTCLILNYDKGYDKIYEGNWLSNDTYLVVHSFATDIERRRKGYAKKMLEEVENLAKSKDIFSIKIDTHMDNRNMRGFLEKNGYLECGYVILEKSGKRIAYEKLIK